MHFFGFALLLILLQIASLLPSNKKRSFVVHSLIKSLGLLEPGKVQIYTPRNATRQDLAMYHASGYLEFILDPKNCNEHDEHRHDASEWEAMKVEYGLEDVGRLPASI